MDNYNITKSNYQAVNDESDYLKIINPFKGFVNKYTENTVNTSGHKVINIYGYINENSEDHICECGCKMHIHSKRITNLKHTASLSAYISIKVDNTQYICPNCGKTIMDKINFKSKNHLITKQLWTTIEDLLASNKYTLTAISELTGVCRNIIKDIDKQRLSNLYLDEKGNIKKPTEYSKYIAIDEFSLHKGHKYATHIIDLETGHVLWIAKGKKKQVVYDFLKHIGKDFSNHIVAVACDMNSDFEEAFKEKCSHITIVYDLFHIVKNFNDKVVNEVRKDEIKRLNDEGKLDEAKSLKNSKYILMSSTETLKQKDKEAKDQKVISKGSKLYNTKPYIRKSGNLQRYKKLIKSNELFFTIDLVKENLKLAYACNTKKEMKKIIQNIVSICNGTKNKHFIWFAKLLTNHLDGIVSHYKYKISTGKIEGLNNKIKTIRRQAYGIRDDDYFFLKVLDISRSKSHKKNA